MRPRREVDSVCLVCKATYNGAKENMSVLVFVALTVAIFALLGLIQRAVERL